MGIMLRAVVIGINEYRDAQYRQKARLHFADNDAQKIAALLQHSETFTTEKVVLLQNEKATREAVREAVQQTFSQRSSDNNTIALLYFAGHGVVNSYDKRISLCCHDVNFADPEPGSIRLNDIYDWFAGSSAECVIAIIDSCFSGGLIAGTLDHLSPAQRAAQAIEALRYPEGKTAAIFAACASTEAARERANLKHGIFTHELLRGWRGAAKESGDGNVYLMGLANFLMQGLTKYVQKPQITVRGSRPIALWHVRPDEQVPPMEPAPAQPTLIAASSPVRDSGKITEQVILPSKRQTHARNIEERNKLLLLFVSLLVIFVVILIAIIFAIVKLLGH